MLIDGYLNGTHVSTLSELIEHVRYPLSFKQHNLTRFLATAYHATVEGGHFTTTGARGYARATEVMNSKCLNNFRWSVVLRTDKKEIWIGIASKLQQTGCHIKDYDKNVILCLPTAGSFFHGEILEGAKNLECQSGDEIHFIFQSKLKKFSIIMVRSVPHAIINSLLIYFGIDFI